MFVPPGFALLAQRTRDSAGFAQRAHGAGLRAVCVINAVCAEFRERFAGKK